MSVTFIMLLLLFVSITFTKCRSCNFVSCKGLDQFKSLQNIWYWLRRFIQTREQQCNTL